MPVLEDEVSHQKVSRYEEELARLQFDDILQKTTRFLAVDDMEEYAKKLVREEKL